MTDTAVFRIISDRRDDIAMDARCMALLTGAGVHDIPPSDDAMWPAALARNGRRRLKEYQAATGDRDADVRDLLIHYARREGVELVREIGSGTHVVVVPAPEGPREEATL
ncbi:hypothetical protein [Gordonia sp. SL306]|uniref:hypothetical protein n=1 Tax=Gordonia sp. SL306 TaxID=2995145 RepID=UPI00226D8931|nr:hypothetical protein [Gordonia sp. SL306]WAC54273.1 hypothetical protein OVA31_16470 [Gordonia sp. SL306]